MKVTGIEACHIICSSPGDGDTMNVYGGEAVNETETKEKYGSDYEPFAW